MMSRDSEISIDDLAGMAYQIMPVDKLYFCDIFLLYNQQASGKGI